MSTPLGFLNRKPMTVMPEEEVIYNRRVSTLHLLIDLPVVTNEQMMH